MSLAESVLTGDNLALARLLTAVEDDSPVGRAALKELFPYTGKAHLIGVTGATGTGKSSLVNQLAMHFRKPESGNPCRVAIVAVDPSSPFTGGALLGDRIRMRDLAGDRGVFIRSMASRGSLGGLARTTSALVQVFDAAGFDLILIETVGAGQAEVEIARLAHTTLVVEAPGLGDDVQAIKAGILEIADILVVNKADRPGVEQTERALKAMLALAHPAHKSPPPSQRKPAGSQSEKASAPEWAPPIQRTIAIDGTGVKELAGAILRHADHLRQTGGWQKREKVRLEAELESLIAETLRERFRTEVKDERFRSALDQLVERKITPWEAVDLLLERKS